jgi:hypothetical protein
MEKEAPHTWVNTKTTNELLVITQIKLSWQYVKHMMDERKEKRISVILGNWLITFDHKTLHYYFKINIKDIVNDAEYVAIRFTTENFKIDQMHGWEFNTYGYHMAINSNKITYNDNIKQCWIKFDTTFITRDVVGAGINSLK